MQGQEMNQIKMHDRKDTRINYLKKKKLKKKKPVTEIVTLGHFHHADQ